MLGSFDTLLNSYLVIITVLFPIPIPIPIPLYLLIFNFIFLNYLVFQPKFSTLIIPFTPREILIFLSKLSIFLIINSNPYTNFFPFHS